MNVCGLGRQQAETVGVVAWLTCGSSFINSTVTAITPCSQRCVSKAVN